MARNRQAGIVLVVVLWGVMLLGVIAASFALSSRTESNLARNLVDNAEARALADAGVHLAVLALLDPDTGEPWRANGTIYPRSLPGGEVLLSAQDEGGKIDLNGASDELLRGLFAAVGLAGDEAAALVDAIVDYRDADDLRRLNGAEDDDYRAAGLANEAKDAPFAILDELRQVMGMTPALYRAVAPALTVFSGGRGIDASTAPAAALGAIPGLDAVAIENMLAARGEDRATFEQAARLALEGLDDYIDASESAIHTVRAEARTAAGAVFVREAVVALRFDAEAPFEILAWRQGSLAVIEDEGTEDEGL